VVAQSGADITIAALPADAPSAPDLGLMKVDVDDGWRVTEFVEKPGAESLSTMSTDTAELFGLPEADAQERPYIASMVRPAAASLLRCSAHRRCTRCVCARGQVWVIKAGHAAARASSTRQHGGGISSCGCERRVLAGSSRIRMQWQLPCEVPGGVGQHGCWMLQLIAAQGCAHRSRTAATPGFQLMATLLKLKVVHHSRMRPCRTSR
jgi:hypothetical protein